MAAIVECLVNGARNADGTAVASGSVAFYQIGTLTPLAVYSDDDATVVLAQPIDLDAGGRPVANGGRVDVYTTDAARMIVQDSTGATVQDIERVNGVVSADSDDIRADALASFGDSRLRYLPTGSAANAMLVKDWMTGLFLNVKAFGAMGDDATDDITSILAAITYSSSLAYPVPIYFPPGVYRHSAPIAITTSGLMLIGAGPGLSELKNTSTTANGVTFTAANDCRITNLKVTTASASTGTGIVLAGGQNFMVDRVEVDAYAVCIGTSGSTVSVSGMVVSNCRLDTSSAGDNICIRLANTFGSGNYGCHIVDCTFNVDNSLTCKMIQIDGSVSAVSVVSSYFHNGLLHVASTYTGFGITVMGCASVGIQTFTVDIDATLPGWTEMGNSWFPGQLAVSDSSNGRSASWASNGSFRYPFGNYGTQTATALGVSGTLTPSLLTGNNFLATLTEPGGGGSIVLTVANPTNATIAKYRGVELVFHIKILGNNISGITWGSEYKTDGAAVVAFNFVHTYTFRWDGANWRQIAYAASLV